MEKANKVVQQARGTHGIVVFFGLALGLVIILGTVLSLKDLRERETDTWRQQLASMSLMLSKTTSDTIFAAYLVLDRVAEHVQSAGVKDEASLRQLMGTPAAHKMLVQGIADFPQIDVATIVGPTGDVINFTRSFPAPAINLAERDYFIGHKDNPNLGDFVSTAVKNKANNKWTFYLSRRLSDSEGNFLGLVIVGLSVDAFTEFFDKVAKSLGDDVSVSLYRDDLTLLARAPAANDVIGKVNRTGPVHLGVTMLQESSLDNVVVKSETPRFSTGKAVPRLVAVRKTGRYPLYIGLIVEDSVYLASWRRSATLIAGIAALSLVLLFLGGRSLAKMLSDREKAAGLLRESEERLRANLEHTPNVAVQWYDSDGRVTYWNPASERLFGWTADEALGKTLDQLILSEQESADFLATLHRIGESGEPYAPREVRARTRANEERYTLSTAFAFPGGMGKIGFARMDVDITARRLAEDELLNHRQHLESIVAERTRELESAKEAAEAASRAKSTFLATMSHELRTPFHGILGMITLAHARMSDLKGRDLLEKAKVSAHRLLGVINDILDISKIEAERLELEATEFRLLPIFEHLMSLFRVSAGGKGIELHVDIAPELVGRDLVGDPLRINQVLVNLVGNAIKFTDRGEVVARVASLGECDGHLHLRFEVADTGIGIDHANQDRLFVAFEQGDSSMSRRYGGSGLGLVICKRLVDLMGGRIGVKSVAGQGSTFWFEIGFPVRPLSTDSGSGHSVASVGAGRHQGRFRGKRVLLAEDDPVNAEVASAMLQDAGIFVKHVVNGEAAVQAASREDFDLILMDMQMPVMSGLEATIRIRNGSMNEGTPILAMTANAFPEDRERCFEAGMNDHLAKPVTPAVLYSALEPWLGER